MFLCPTQKFINNRCIGLPEDPQLYLRKVYGRGLKWGKQPFLDTDMHIIFGPEDDISKLSSYERIKENF